MKKLFSSKAGVFVLVMVMVCGYILIPGISFDGNFASAKGQGLLKGDMDDDGVISASDARAVLRTSVGLEEIKYITDEDFNNSQPSKPNNSTYRAGETWKVAGKFAITVNSVCEVKNDSGYAQEISIDISAENIGMSDGLEIANNPAQYSFYDGIIGVYDEDSYIGNEVGYQRDIGIISVGKKGKGKLNWTFDSRTETVTIDFCIDEQYTATFIVDVTPYEEAEKDAATEAVLNPISLPATYSVYNYNGSLLTQFKVLNLSYTYSGTTLKLNVTGEKLYDSEGANYSRESKIGYKLYDIDGFVVDSGTIYTDSIKTGDKVKNVTENIYDVAPGVYTLELISIK